METQFFIQKEVEIDANIMAVEKSLLPAVMTNCRENADIVSNYLRQRCVVNGRVDASKANIGKAIAACVNAIFWDVPPAPPKKQPDVQGITRGVPNYNQAIIDGNIAIAKDNERRGIAEATRKEEEAIKKILHTCESLCQTAHRQTVAKKERLRADLTEMFNEGLANLKRNVSNKKHSQQLQEAQTLLDKMKAYVDSNVHMPSGYLPTGW